MEESRSTLESSCEKGEEEFYVLKFPLKLWRIINESQSSAIMWGCFGKTILIDYNLFQAEYLECPVPKFKTRNMTSFVRQLNMYGFKKMQIQQRNIMSKYCNIHEFFNENFRYGRPDLLCNVKRRTIPLKMERMSHSSLRARKFPRAEFCRKFFEETLINSPELFSFWKMSPLFLAGGEGERVIQPTYQVQVIPAVKVTIEPNDNTLTAEIFAAFRHLVLDEPGQQLDEPPESEGEDVPEDGLDPLAFEMSIPAISPTAVWMQPKEESQHVNNPNFREGFNGTHYIMDVTGEMGGPLKNEDTDGEIETDFKENIYDQLGLSAPVLDLTAEHTTRDPATGEVMIHIPEPSESEEFYLSLANSFTNV